MPFNWKLNKFSRIIFVFFQIDKKIFLEGIMNKFIGEINGN